MDICKIDGNDYIRIYSSTLEDDGTIKTNSVYKQIYTIEKIKCIADRNYNNKTYCTKYIPIDKSSFNEKQSLLKLKLEIEDKICNLSYILDKINNLILEHN